MGRLSGKTAIVSGAAEGIGKATAQIFAKEGAQVIATDINWDKLTELQGIPGIETRVLDAVDVRAVGEFALEVKNTDILCNCVGFIHSGSILDCEEQSWDFSFNVNVKSPYLMCRQFLPSMIKKKKGSIINMASVASNIKGVANRCAFGASKAAVIGLTKSIAVDYGHRGIRCNCICPGVIDTPSLHQITNNSQNPANNWTEMLSQQRMGRIGQPEEVAMLCVYLASDESSFTNGAEFVIDGGWSA